MWIKFPRYLRGEHDDGVHEERHAAARHASQRIKVQIDLIRAHFYLTGSQREVVVYCWRQCLHSHGVI